MDGTGEALLAVSALLVNARRPGQGTACTRNLLLAQSTSKGEGETGQGGTAADPEPCAYPSGVLAPSRSVSNWPGFFHSTHTSSMLDRGIRPGVSNLTKTLPLASKTPAWWEETVSPLAREAARPKRGHCRTQLVPWLLLVREGFPEELPLVWALEEARAFCRPQQGLSENLEWSLFHPFPAKQPCCFKRFYRSP